MKKGREGMTFERFPEHGREGKRWFSQILEHEEDSEARTEPWGRWGGGWRQNV